MDKGADGSLQAKEVPSKRKKRSAIWNYFTDVGDCSAQCDCCKQSFKCPRGTTTTLQNHLEAKHAVLYKELMKDKEKIHELEGTCAKKKPVLQPTLTEMFRSTQKMSPSDPKAQSITKQIAKMVATELLPYEFVEGCGFKELMGHKNVAPTYTVPCRTTFSEHYIPALYEETKHSLKKMLVQDLPTISSIAFTSDGWTSRSTDSYISLTCHYLRPDFTSVSFAMSNTVVNESHTSVQVATTIKNVLIDWEIDPAVTSIPLFCITDNAHNFRQASVSLFKDGSRSCFAHTLQIAIENSKNDCPGTTTLLSKARSIVGHYRRSTRARKRLHTFQEQLNMPKLEVIQHIDTRWCSEYQMLKRLLEMKPALVADHVNSGDTDMLTALEWKHAENFVQVLQPLAEATEEMSGNTYPTLSMIIPVLHCLLCSLESHITAKKDGMTLARALHKNLKSRFPNYMQEPLQRAAMLVDPRFKGVLLSTIESEAILLSEIKSLKTDSNPVQEAKSSIPNSAPTSSLWAVFDSIPMQENKDYDEGEEEVRRYLKEPRINRHDNPLNWWKNEGTKYRYLSKVALKYLGVPSTQVNSERLFSAAGNVVSARRENLLPQHVEQLVFLHANLK
ncbi:zinc finger BED domain-containing protein 4-like isoform X1 [Bacillus rossius redtenbacheri]|uniref:zinc finger BED domain-containing protein 4-like isoform X1 n=1 Tax=Bacillus rossius redtenbacheri TaxID=93214 RepID=UPI002FDEF6A5